MHNDYRPGCAGYEKYQLDAGLVVSCFSLPKPRP